MIFVLFYLLHTDSSSHTIFIKSNWILMNCYNLLSFSFFRIFKDFFAYWSIIIYREGTRPKGPTSHTVGRERVLPFSTSPFRLVVDMFPTVMMRKGEINRLYALPMERTHSPVHLTVTPYSMYSFFGRVDKVGTVNLSKVYFETYKIFSLVHRMVGERRKDKVFYHSFLFSKR